MVDVVLQGVWPSPNESPNSGAAPWLRRLRHLSDAHGIAKAIAAA